jgi:hypothetical protein
MLQDCHHLGPSLCTTRTARSRHLRPALLAIAVVIAFASCKNKDNSLPPEPKAPDPTNVRVTPSTVPATPATPATQGSDSAARPRAR